MKFQKIQSLNQVQHHLLQNGNIIFESISKFFILIGDVIQIVIDYGGSDLTWDESQQLLYTKSELASSDIKDEINLTDSSSTSDTDTTSTDSTNTTETTNTIEETSTDNTNTIGNNTVNTTATDNTNTTDTNSTDTTEATVVTKTVSSEIDNEDGNTETAYTSSTEIPYIPVDIYATLTNNLELLDINFFDSSATYTKKLRDGVQGIVDTAGHAVLYICAALVLTMIIWRSVLLVSSSISGNPNGVVESRKIIDNIFVSVAMVAGVYIIMALSTYLYEYILSIVLNGYESNLIIKLEVEDVYSFNTNIIGWIKYMTLRSNTLAAFGYSFIYMIMAIADGIWFFIMFIRMIAVAVFTIIAPFTAVNVLRNKNNQTGGVSAIFNFDTWMSIYMAIVWIPLAFLILLRVVIQL